MKHGIYKFGLYSTIYYMMEDFQKCQKRCWHLCKVNYCSAQRITIFYRSILPGLKGPTWKHPSGTILAPQLYWIPSGSRCYVSNGPTNNPRNRTSSPVTNPFTQVLRVYIFLFSDLIRQVYLVAIKRFKPLLFKRSFSIQRFQAHRGAMWQVWLL